MRIETREDAVTLRHVLEPFWREYYDANGKTDGAASTNMCVLTSEMVVQVDPQWRTVDGTVAGKPHTWCEREDGTVLDLTADQFGGTEVVWGERPVTYEPYQASR